MIEVIATVTFRIPYPVLVFAGILLLTLPPAHRPFQQAVDATGAALLGAGFAVLLAITTYEQPSRSVETIAADLNDKVDLAGSRRRCARTQALHCR